MDEDARRTNDILEEVAEQRAHQRDKYGNDVDDVNNMPGDWATYIGRYAFGWKPAGFPPYSEETLRVFRDNMVKVAALAVAAVESYERGAMRGTTRSWAPLVEGR